MTKILYRGEIIYYDQEGECIQSCCDVEAESILEAKPMLELSLLKPAALSHENTWFRITREGVEVEASQLVR